MTALQTAPQIISTFWAINESLGYFIETGRNAISKMLGKLADQITTS
jgi:hypothetical protein